MPRDWSVDELVARLGSPDELALIDAREQGTYSESHLLFAVNVPRSRLELRMADLVPRRDTTVVVTDDGVGDVAADTAQQLERLGWTDVGVLDGGNAAWAAAGHELYSGVNVPSKLFGELVELHYGTPHVSAAELATWQRDGRSLVVLDSRTEREFNRMSIPGGRSCPGGELVHRVFDQLGDADTTIVVNCAGRTRSILGAQSLRSAGIDRAVVALENGTMGWELAGLELDHGRTEVVPPPSPPARAQAISAAAEVGERFSIDRVTIDVVDRWLVDTARTTYVLDVRSPAEFAQGHLPGSRNAPGGQLVQATDEYVGTRGARLVLVDDDGTRATMTGSWLAQMGWADVHVLTDVGRSPRLERGSPATGGPAGTVTVDAVPDDAVIVDVGSSRDHERSHPAGALWALRGRLDEASASVPDGATVVLTSPDGSLADLARPEAQAAFAHAARVESLSGGTAAWVAAGRRTDSGMTRSTTTPDDVWMLPYDPGDAEVARRAMEGYLVWEVALVEQYENDPLVDFPLLSRARPPGDD